LNSNLRKVQSLLSSPELQIGLHIERVEVICDLKKGNAGAPVRRPRKGITVADASSSSVNNWEAARSV
jgi:hypothetical protein